VASSSSVGGTGVRVGLAVVPPPQAKIASASATRAAMNLKDRIGFMYISSSMDGVKVEG
jgi:hypothetical protein